MDLLIQNFEVLANAPGGVPKLRELILRLAKEGRLVPQLPHETPVRGGSTPSETPINVEVLPTNWRTVRLREALETRSGNSKLIKGRLCEAPRPELFQGFSASGPDVWCDAYEHEGEAIVVSAVGARCGKAFKATGKWSAIANTHIVRADPDLFIFDFAFLLLNDESFWVRGGSAQPFVKFPPSLDRFYAIPPLAEQHRIVAKVDELMGLCDVLEARQEEARKTQAALTRSALHHLTTATAPAEFSNRLVRRSPQGEVGWNFIADHFPQLIARPENVAELRRAILQLAVMGRLVPQSTAEISQSVPVLHKDKQPFPIPENWAWTRLADIDDPDRGITYGVLVPGPEVETGVPLIRVQDLHPSDPFESPTKRIAKTVADQYQRTVLKGDEVLVGVVGSIGRIGVVPDAWRGAVIARAVCRVVPSPILDRRYLLTALQAPMAQDFFTSTTRTLAQPTLNVGQLEGTPIPLPPLAEQHRIVAKVDELMKLCDELEAGLTRERAEADRLFDAMAARLR
ncbi:MAG TPA: restriction endonuclease subunit S [Kiritimatiellia bacterium]|nr:restriction endonuclease subunit S [Kiritimatiellia bacterium]